MPETNNLQRFLSGASIATLLMFSGLTNAAGVISYSFKTDIREVSAGTLGDDDYLTIEINQAVGPIDCRSNILRVEQGQEQLHKIETLAMSALLQQDQVMITIPVSRGDCIDGSPAILDIHLLHNS